MKYYNYIFRTKYLLYLYNYTRAYLLTTNNLKKTIAKKLQITTKYKDMEMCLNLNCIFHYDRPSGWDSEKKISILFDSMTTVKPDDPYEDVILKPTVRKVSFPIWFGKYFNK